MATAKTTTKKTTTAKKAAPKKTAAKKPELKIVGPVENIFEKVASSSLSEQRSLISAAA